MSPESQTKETIKKESRPLFGRLEKKIVKDALWDQNPISIQILGICSALAVTVQMTTTTVMCLAVIAVVALSNTVVSAVRKFIPNEIRIIVEIAIISTLVIMADQILQAFLFDISKQLSIFVGLIITNCIVLGRTEGFAMSNPVFPSFVDGAANALGYSWIPLTVAFFRALLGSGTLFGIPVVPEPLYALGYQNMGLMVLAPGAFFVLGLLIWVQNSIILSKKGH